MNALDKDLSRWAEVTADTLRRLPGPGPVEAPPGPGALAALEALRRDPPKRGERAAILIGGGEGARRLVAGLAAPRAPRLRLAGIFDDREEDREPAAPGVPRLGSVDEVIAFARAAEVDLIVMTLPLTAERRILSLLRRLWVLPAEIRLSAYSQDFSGREFALDDGPLIPALRKPIPRFGRAVKRAMDVVLSAFGLVLAAPVMAAAALAVRLSGPGPILFRQRRQGLNHGEFEVLKFRTLHHVQADPTARKLVTKDDPRVTRPGRWLRRTSLDELPQLWNVLKGEMSLVGPRPHAVGARSSQQETFDQIVDGYSGRHRVRPGLTGLAQVEGWRGEVDNALSLRRRFEADLRYIDGWSLWLDVKIMLATPWALVKTSKAY
ncbi:MAG: exopolysaccharide biosynthesis polyprenyl glycosylphosphotransferase [Pseudomonadota bacterium]